MIGLVILPILLVQSQIYESNFQESNQFLKGKISTKNQYEKSREIVENTRESCLYQYRQEQTSSQRRQNLSPICKQYCSETDDCQQENEQSACTNPLYPIWPKRTMKFVQKYQRTCYIRITEIVRYDRAEEICTQHGLQLAIIDNIPLLEYLKQMNMFNSTCRGQCPQARGYYIGLRRQMIENNSSWIWSNNVTWTQNETECNDEDYSNTSFANSTYLCYTDVNGEKKVTVWNDDEPNNRRYNQFQPGEQCVEIIARPNHDGSIEQIGKLNDIPCNKPILGVICQINDLKPVNSTKFQYFATLIGFNETNNEENNLFKDLFGNLTGSIEINLDAMATIMTALENLLILPSFTSEQATNIFNIVDQLVNMTGQIEIIDDDSSLKRITNKLLHFLDLFPAKIIIQNNTDLSFQNANLHTSIIEIQLNDEELVDDWFAITSSSFENQSEIIIEINFEILKDIFDLNKTYRIIETTFSNFNLFPQFNQSQYQLQGIPISYHIVNETSFETEQEFIRFRIRFTNLSQQTNLSCAYWSFEDKNGSWKIDDSCRFAGYVNNYAQCYCKHLTHFALLIVPESKRFIDALTTVEEFLINFVTYIGIILSIVGLVITLITYLVFRYSNRNHLHQSLFMLCLALLCVNCLYLPFSQTKPTTKLFDSIHLCNLFGFFLHYFLLSSFLWMLIITTVQYMYFVRIFDRQISKYFLKTSLIGWIFPLLFPILIILIGENGGYTSREYCWINNDILLYTTFVAPICMILCYNLTVFLFTIRSICQKDSTNQIDNKRSKLQLSIVFCCFISIICTWLFGIFVLIEPIFIYQFIFCLSNSFQGFFILLLHVYFTKSQSSSDQTDTKDSNVTTTRPVKFRFTSNMKKPQTAAINPAFEDVQVPQIRQTNLNPPPRPDFLYDRIQRAKLAKKTLYA